MKPTVPETGVVIKNELYNATVMLEAGKSCKGCGAAKIGLCRSGGGSMFLTARNTMHARPGDRVIIGIDAKTRRTGYLLAYIIPLAAFISGAIAGNLLGTGLSMPYLDVLGAFSLLVFASAFTLTSLKKLDRSHQMEIRRIISDGEFREYVPTAEEQSYSTLSGPC